MILVDLSVVHMGKITQGDVAWISTIKVKTNDGVVRTLSNICHVFDLKRNLISLGTLEFKGCKYSNEGWFLKVSNGTQTLIEGLKHGNVYVFQGSTVTSSSSIIASLSSPNDIFAYKSPWKLHPSAKSKHFLELN